jgi:uncharacterized membrane protein
MNPQAVQFVMVHGSIVLLLGVLTGFPFWVAIIRESDRSTVRAWRVAHTTLISSGLAILVVGLMAPYISLTSALGSVLAWGMVVSGYSFAFAMVLGAITGSRALTVKPIGLNTILFVGHLVGGAGAIIGVCVLVYGLT